MRAVHVCFSILQVPRCRIHTLTNFWQESHHNLNRTCGNNYSFRLLASKADDLEGGYSRRWIGRPFSTKTDRRNKISQNGKPTTIRHEVLEETVSNGTTLNLNKTGESEIQNITYCDNQVKIAENKDLTKLVTVIVFDIETTGFSRQNERIIEIALQDLHGGENSTFQSLVNPERYVPNSNIHGITTHMVCRPEVPRMTELIPILLQFVRSRQKPGGYVLLVAHNARTFDVPFLTNEFIRCSVDIPSNWLFVDTLPLAREVMKLKGSKNSKTSLEALCERYNIESVGSAHRAMSDVKVLSLVLQKLTFDLELPLSGLVRQAFRPLDSTNLKKKN